MMNLRVPYDHLLPQHRPFAQQLVERAATPSMPAPNLEVAYVWARPSDPIDPQPGGAHAFTVPPPAGVTVKPTERPWLSMIAVPHDDLRAVAEHTGVYLLGATAQGLHCYVAVVVR